jgi:AAA+ ATPase superfamily predicted ATPase
MKFINRHQGIQRLNRLAKSDEEAVAVVWGRRRVGKTRLLLEWSHRNKGIYYMADESTASVQRKYLALTIEQIIPGFASVEYPDWNSLFSRLAKDALHMGWRGPLIIDELPYLISTSPEFPSILQRFIDHDAKKAKLTVALCGSSQRMMQGAILDASAPLYGRANEIIKLGPLSAGYVQEAINIKTAQLAVEFYAVWGGIPRYWELANNTQESFLETIDYLVLNPLGILNDEPNRLLLEESAMSLRPVLDAIGLGSHRASEIAARIGLPVTSITKPIQRLMELDLVEREMPFGVDEQNSKRSLYKIKDPFMRFWFDIIAPKRSYLMQATASQRIIQLKEYLPKIFSLAWEDLCRSAVPFLSISKKMSFGKASRFWHGKGPEWDILAKSVDGDYLLIGEAKWTAKNQTNNWIYKTIEELKNKGIPPEQSNKKAIYALFIPEKPAQLELPPNVYVIDAKEVLSVLK